MTDTGAYQAPTRVPACEYWQRIMRSDRRGRLLADRHYSRQVRGSAQFAPPGRALVLLTPDAAAVWATSWQRYVQRTLFPDAWVCSIFRNESPILSSTLIREAVAATRAVFGEPPSDGMVTMVDETAVRHKRDPGRCFRKAGVRPCGYTTTRHFLVLRLDVEDMPDPAYPGNAQLSLLDTLPPLLTS